MSVLSQLALKISSKEIGYETNITDGNALSTILDMVYLWAGIIAVLIIVIAGALFVTSRGDAAQIKRSKDATRGAVVGLIVVMIAFILTRFVIGRI